MYYGSGSFAMAISTAAVQTKYFLPGLALNSGKPLLLLDFCWNKTMLQNFEAAQLWVAFFKSLFNKKKYKKLVPFVFQSLAKEHLLFAK